MNTSCVTRPSISARTLSAPSCSGRHAARAPISLRPGCTAGLKSRGHRCAHSAVCPATKSSQQDNKGFLSSFLPNSDDDKLEKSSDENNGASSGLDNGAPSEQGSDGVPTFSKRLMSGDQIMASYLSGRVRQVGHPIGSPSPVLHTIQVVRLHFAAGSHIAYDPKPPVYSTCLLAIS